MKQPEALRLAGSVDDVYTYEYTGTDDWIASAANELERQHALIAELVEALEQMRRWMPVYPTAADGIKGGREAHAAAMNAANLALSKAKES